MLLQRRQASPSTGNSVLARSSAPSDERNASAASLIGPVETPVLWMGKSPGTILPSVVIPLKASASDASPPCAYARRNSVGCAGKARAEAGGRCLTFMDVLLSGDGAAERAELARRSGYCFVIHQGRSLERPPPGPAAGRHLEPSRGEPIPAGGDHYHGRIRQGRDRHRSGQRHRQGRRPRAAGGRLLGRLRGPAQG